MNSKAAGTGEWVKEVVGVAVCECCGDAVLVEVERFGEKGLGRHAVLSHRGKETRTILPPQVAGELAERTAISGGLDHLIESLYCCAALTRH